MTDEVAGLPAELIEAAMVPELPEPWIFDGYRRLYEDVQPTGVWTARAIDPRTVQAEKGTGRATVAHLAGSGATLIEARDNLLALLKLDRV